MYTDIIKKKINWKCAHMGTYTSDLNNKKWSHLKCHLENL